MTLVYFDTSALVKLLVDEDGTDLAVRLWDGADAVLTHPVVDAELATVLTAAARTGKLDPAEADRAFDTWLGYRCGVRWCQPEVEPTELYALGDRHILRGADLLHLTSALLLRGTDAVMAVWDPQLSAAASTEGLRAVPHLAA